MIQTTYREPDANDFHGETCSFMIRIKMFRHSMNTVTPDELSLFAQVRCIRRELDLGLRCY